MGAAAGEDPIGDPIGPPVPGWTARPPPPRTPIEGRRVRIEPLDPDRHAGDLLAAWAADAEGRLWRYLPYGPFATVAAYGAHARAHWLGAEPVVYALVEPASGRALGQASYLNIDPANGAIEVGGIILSPALQRTVAATEAMYLMMRRAFDELGYRRYAWQCNALNARSRAAAERLGFTFEGVFRQARVAKGHNRDTAWFSILDGEWPRVRAAFERWLDPANFDAAGRQRAGLAALRT